ncbi:MAG: endonuclease MutS2 [Clostridia bacterium]|nr:endonuclease MutS2 [Clostridia bacterium]
MKIKKTNKALELNKVLEMLSEQAQSAQGRELCLEIRPDNSFMEVTHLLQMTDDAFVMLQKYGAPSFSGVRNINNSVKRAQAGGFLNMKELLDVAEFLRTIRGVGEWRNHSSSVKTSLDSYFDNLTPNKFLEERIFGAIISEEEMADNASPELADIRRKKRNASSRIRDQLGNMIHSSYYQKFLQEPIVTMRNGRYVVPVKVEYRSEIAGMVHDTSSSGATLFVEPSVVVEANNEIKVLESKERHEIERILAELSSQVSGFAETILHSFECAVSLDIIFAKARLAHNMRASRPLVNNEGRINLISARHPLISAQRVVPINIWLGTDYSTLVITGPNTGGKTVSLKTLGLFTLMAMCGLMLPCEEGSEISVFDDVLADIGDEQSIEQSLSTFSAHITNIIDIFKRTNDRTLILLDELGAGTDPTEGAALAIAILEALSKKGAKVASTTHYAELKVYALDTDGVENASCEFDVATLRPTYRLLIGTPGRSNAFAISQRLGIDQSIIDRAGELVSSDSKGFELVSEKLEQSRIAMERERAEAEEMKRQAAAELERAQKKREQIEQAYEKEILRAQSEAKRISESARRTSSQLIDELERFCKEKEKADARELLSKARRAVKSSMDKLDEVTSYDHDGGEDDEEYTLPRELVVGDTVYVRAMKSNAVVTELPDKKGMVGVTVGMIKTKVKITDLRLVAAPKKQPERSAHRNTSRLSAKIEASAVQSIDLRGKNVEEAILELDFFIDSSLTLAVNEITIIHGKGTGVLRAGVHQYLKKHPSIRTFRLGTFGEGETGVTIAQLK